MLKKVGAVGLIFFLNKYFFGYFVISVVGATGITQQISDGAGYYVFLWVLNDVMSYLFPAVMLYLLFKRELCEKPRLCRYKYRNAEALLFYSASVFVGMVGSKITSAVYDFFASDTLSDPIRDISPIDGVEFAVFFVSVCVFGPVFEEFIFRYLLIKPLRKHGDLFAVIISSLFFAISHGNLYQFAYVLAGGFFYAALAVRSGSLIPSIAVHILNNVIVTLGSYSQSPALISAAEYVSLALGLSGVVSLGALIIMKRFSFSRNEFDASPREKTALFLKSPAALAGIAMSLLIFINIFIKTD